MRGERRLWELVGLEQPRDAVPLLPLPHTRVAERRDRRPRLRDGLAGAERRLRGRQRRIGRAGGAATARSGGGRVCFQPPERGGGARLSRGHPAAELRVGDVLDEVHLLGTPGEGPVDGVRRLPDPHPAARVEVAQELHAVAVGVGPGDGDADVLVVGVVDRRVVGGRVRVGRIEGALGVLVGALWVGAGGEGWGGRAERAGGASSPGEAMRRGGRFVWVGAGCGGRAQRWRKPPLSPNATAWPVGLTDTQTACAASMDRPYCAEMIPPDPRSAIDTMPLCSARRKHPLSGGNRQEAKKQVPGWRPSAKAGQARPAPARSHAASQRPRARLALPMRTVEENFGRKCSIEGPVGQGTVESGRSVARTSQTCPPGGGVSADSA